MDRDHEVRVDEHQAENLQTTLDDADSHTQDKDQEWGEGAKKVHDLDDDPPKRKEDFPSDGKADFETIGDDENPPPGSPEHDRGVISGS